MHTVYYIHIRKRGIWPAGMTRVVEHLTARV
jgi:hypothetical protein